MSKPLKPKKKSYPKNPETKSCYYCGSNKIEHLEIRGVGVIRTCKDCKEQLD
jgi:hypothetical protein